MAASLNAAEKVSKSWQDSKLIKERTKYLLDHIEIIPTDITFRLGSDEVFEDISAHRLILAISSEVFHAMLYGDLRERHDIVRIPDVDQTAFRVMIGYLYTEEMVGLTMENVMDCLYCAKKYMVVNLTDHCRSFVFDNLDAEMACMIFAQASKIIFVPQIDHLDEENLHQFAAAVVCQHTIKAFSSDRFLELPPPLFRDLLARDHLSATENESYQETRRWVLKCRSANTSMEEAFAGIIDCIRLPLLSPSEMADGPYADGALSPEVFGLRFQHQLTTSFKSAIPFSAVPRSSCTKRFYGVIQLSVDQALLKVHGVPVKSQLVGRLHFEVFTDLAPMCSQIFLNLPPKGFVIKYGKVQFDNEDGCTAAKSDVLPEETSILPFDPYWMSLELVKNKTATSVYQLHISDHSGESVTDGIVFAKVVNGMEFLRRADAMRIGSDERWNDAFKDVWSGVLRKTNWYDTDFRLNGARKDPIKTIEEYDEYIRKATMDAS